MTTCPDWRRLAAHRLEPTAVEPEGWAEALVHLDGCPACRREALAADPTLVFRRLPRPEIAAESAASEAESMRQAVAAMRAASRVQQAKARAHGAAGWRRWAAAAVLAIVGLSAGKGSTGRPAVSVPPTLVAQPAEVVAPAAAAHTSAPADLLPLVEDLNHPEARVSYQTQEDDHKVVMIVGIDV